MARGWMAIALALALCACGPRAGEKAEAPVPAAPTAPASGPPEIAHGPAGCSAAADAVWRPFPGEVYEIAASAEGAVCSEALAVMTVKAPGGKVVLRLELPVAASPALFADANDAISLAEALQVWATADVAMPTSGALPEWRLGAAQPTRGEFPFYVEPSLDRAGYEALRSRELPLFCVVQGAESVGCHALDPSTGAFSKVGAQSFPG